MHSIKAYGGTEMVLPFIPILGTRPIEEAAEWTALLVWTFRRAQKGLPLPRIDPHFLGRPVHFLVSVTTEIYRVFNLKDGRQLSREYFTSDAIYNGSAGMTLYYYMCRSWQHCCRRG